MYNIYTYIYIYIYNFVKNIPTRRKPLFQAAPSPPYTPTHPPTHPYYEHDMCYIALKHILHSVLNLTD